MSTALHPPIAWSPRTALDPRHRPQVLTRPSGTVRREWARFPQEAHLLDEENKRIRRLSHEEIALLQGFSTSWFDTPGVSEANLIRAIGNAVPPPLARAVLSAVAETLPSSRRTNIELCAGAGGLAAGLHQAAAGFETLALVDNWPVAGKILRQGKPWDASAVHVADIRDFPLAAYRGRVGVLTGGLPCQPFSNAGARAGSEDPRDLLGFAAEVLASVAPDAFVFENVPGLASGQFAAYLSAQIQRMRQPRPGLGYGVMAVLLNAASFGLPQVRRRLFIVGLLGAATRDVQTLLDRVDSAVTHRHNASWRVVNDVVGPTLESGRWMSWPYGSPASFEADFPPEA